MAEVVFDQVGKVYEGNVRAVSDVNLHIDDGEFVVFVGPSGCGKSTSLRMIAGLEDITEGTISIGNRVVNDVPPKDRDIAMVFQNYALYPHMSVYKNMAFGLKLRKMPKPDIDKRVRWAADILGLKPLLDRKPKALSGGQRQRVAVGRAIVRQPKAFLFDEPLSNLDAKLRVTTRAELKRLHRRLATTTIYVTHDQEEAMTLGDRVVVMSEGFVQQFDTPLHVYNYPKNRFVAGFLGTPPMNFLDGRIVRQEGIWFDGSGVKIKLEGQKADMLADYDGQAVVFGIRPEGLFLRETAGADNPDQVMELTAQVIEPLGNAMDIYADTSTGDRVVARVKAEPMDAETKVKLFVDMTKVHLFEPNQHEDDAQATIFGKNITLPEAAMAMA